MKQLGFFFDARRCNGCKTCVVACKDAHNLSVGRNFRHVLEVTDGKWSKDPKSGAWKQNVYAYYLSIACNHCSDPACVKACPQRALEFGDIEELRKKHGNVDTIYPLPQPAATHPNLVIHAPLKHP